MNHAGAEAVKNLNIAMGKVKNKLFLSILIILIYNSFLTSKQIVSDSEDAKHVSAHQPPAENSYYYFSRGIIEENKGNIPKALFYFKRALEEDENSDIAEEIASAYLQLNDLTNALAYAQKAININPENIDHRFMLVNLYLLQHDYKKALIELKKIIKIEDDNFEVYYDIASIHQNIGNYKQAIFYYNKVLNLNQNHESSLYNLGNIYYNLSQKKKAIEYFKKYMQYSDNNLEGKFIYAYLLTLTGEYRQAEMLYRELYNQLPNNSQLLKELIEIYYQTEDDENCKKHLSLFSKTRPQKKNDKNFMLYRAMDLQLNSNYDEAEGLFFKVIKLNENDLNANYGLYKIYMEKNNREKLKEVIITLGKIFYNNENFPSAITFFNRYKKIFPNETSSYSYLGIVYESMEEYGKGVKELEEAVKLEPDDIKLNFYLGVLLEQSKSNNRAINQFNKVIRLDKKHQYSYIRLGYIYNRLEQTGKAIQILKKAIEEIPGDSDLYFLLGINYSKIENYNEAIKTFKKGISFNEKDHLLNFQLAITFDKNNDKEHAIDKLLICLKLDNKDPEVNNYLAYLYSELDRNLDDAKKYINISLDVDEENYAYQDTAGWIYFRLKDYKKAKIFLEKARENMVKKNIYEKVIYEHLIQVYEKLQNSKMVDHYKQYLDSDKSKQNKKN